MPALIRFIWLVPLVIITPVAIASESEDRMPGNHESWIAFAIVAFAVFCAWSLNHVRARMRAIGTLTAALGCFAVVTWFFVYVYGSGIIDSPKPYDARLDAAKPGFLWIAMTLSLLGGLTLLRIAKRQFSASRTLRLSNLNESQRYGRISRILHWTTAILFIIMIPMGIFATMIPEGTPFRLEYYVVHKTVGVIIFVLVVLRLVWNVYSTRPALDKHIKPMERKLAHAAHIVLYTLLLLLPITGFIMTSYFGAPTYLFALEMAPLWESNEKAVLLWGLLHKYLLPYLVYMVLGAHILGVLKHQFYDKHRHILKRMVS